MFSFLFFTEAFLVTSRYVTGPVSAFSRGTGQVFEVKRLGNNWAKSVLKVISLWSREWRPLIPQIRASVRAYTFRSRVSHHRTMYLLYTASVLYFYGIQYSIVFLSVHLFAGPEGSVLIADQLKCLQLATIFVNETLVSPCSLHPLTSLQSVWT